MKVFGDYLMYFIMKESRMLYNRWLRPVSSAEFRKGAEELHRLLSECQVERWLLDASCCNTPARDDQEWVVARIGDVVKGEDVCLRKIALVKSNDVFFGVIAEWMQEELLKLHGETLRMRCFDSLADANRWLLGEGTSKAGVIPSDEELGLEGQIKV